MQRRTIWDQSISSGLTSSRVERVSGAAGRGTLGLAPYRRHPRRPASRGSRPAPRRRLAGAASPTTLQLNVPTHCIGGSYAGFIPFGSHIIHKQIAAESSQWLSSISTPRGSVAMQRLHRLRGKNPASSGTLFPPLSYCSKTCWKNSAGHGSKRRLLKPSTYGAIAPLSLCRPVLTTTSSITKYARKPPMMANAQSNGN